MEAFREIAYLQMLEDQKALLARYRTTFDRWFSERTLYEVADGDSSAVDKALAAMSDKGYVYEKDGATWFRSTAFGDEKDRVLIKENGEFTYFTSDVAYHYDKIMRGFDHLIDLWGADHHGYIKRCEAMLEAWGYPGKLEVVLGQLVNLLRNGEPVRMSKRTGEMVTFEELIDEVGVDATRFIMLSRSSRRSPSTSTSRRPRRATAPTPSTTCSTRTPASAPSYARPRLPTWPLRPRQGSARWKTWPLP